MLTLLTWHASLTFFAHYLANFDQTDIQSDRQTGNKTLNIGKRYLAYHFGAAPASLKEES